MPTPAHGHQASAHQVVVDPPGRPALVVREQRAAETPWGAWPLGPNSTRPAGFFSFATRRCPSRRSRTPSPREASAFDQLACSSTTVLVSRRKRETICRAARSTPPTIDVPSVSTHTRPAPSRARASSWVARSSYPGLAPTSSAVTTSNSPGTPSTTVGDREGDPVVAQGEQQDAAVGAPCRQPGHLGQGHRVGRDPLHARMVAHGPGSPRGSASFAGCDSPAMRRAVTASPRPWTPGCPGADGSGQGVSRTLAAMRSAIPLRTRAAAALSGLRAASAAKHDANSGPIPSRG